MLTVIRPTRREPEDMYSWMSAPFGPGKISPAPMRGTSSQTDLTPHAAFPACAVVLADLASVLSSELCDLQAKMREVPTHSNSMRKKRDYTSICKSCSSELDASANICEVCGDHQAPAQAKMRQIPTHPNSMRKKRDYTCMCKSCSSELDASANICEVCGDHQAPAQTACYKRSVSVCNTTVGSVGHVVQVVQVAVCSPELDLAADHYILNPKP